MSGWTLPTVHSYASQLTAAWGDFEKKEREEVGCLRRTEELKKSQTLTSPSTSHSKVLSPIAAALYDDDNGASERSERAQLDDLILESNGVSFRF